MKILYVAPYDPFPVNSGAKFRIASLVRAFAALGELHLVVVGEDASGVTPAGVASHAVYPAFAESRLAKLRRYVLGGVTRRGVLPARFLDDAREAELERLVSRLRPDLLVLGDTYVAALHGRLRGAAGRTVIDTHNVESALLSRIRDEARGAARWRYAWLARSARRLEGAWPRDTEVWAVSDADAAAYRAHGFSRVSVVPNVVDVERYRADRPCVPGRVVFTGWYEYWPNEDAALRLVRHARALREEGVPLELRLVGRDPTARMREAALGATNVEITGAVDDVAPHVESAHVFAAPLHAGSGTKLKILEAMAAGRLVLTTPIGAEGLPLEDGRHALVAPDEDAFRARLRDVLTGKVSPSEVARIGAEARRLVEGAFSQSAVTERVRALVGGP